MAWPTAPLTLGIEGGALGGDDGAGFPEVAVHECHGSIRFMQCAAPCQAAVWPTDAATVEKPDAELRVSTTPCCPKCGGIARPNILMFGDGDFIWTRAEEQVCVLPLSGGPLSLPRRPSDAGARVWGGWDRRRGTPSSWRRSLGQRGYV